MKVFKFGGASIKDAEAVRNVAKIIRNYPEEQLVVVISAMGKTTNALEELVEAYYAKQNTDELLNGIKAFHFSILDDLFSDKNDPIYQEVHNVFVEIEWQIEDEPIGTYDFEYDQMVCMGELLSTKIVSAFLSKEDISNKWVDARNLVWTDNAYRRAKVDWELSAKSINKELRGHFKKEANQVVITQGFIGSTTENYSSTLGREGSDFSAAIFAYCLDAEEVIIWKDVEGMLNADPKYYENTIKLNRISYLEAVELAYYGASVIHPKTIKPLQNKGILLRVKSFINPGNMGSLISANSAEDSLLPSFIHKPDQRLISIAALDYSFISESNLSQIYELFSKHNASINIMQNSAISFSACVDEEPSKLESLIEALKKNFKVSYNIGLTLITIRHYSEEIIDQLVANKEVLLEQRTRNTARYVVREKSAGNQ